MRRGGTLASLGASPTMVGAVTVLVSVMAVFLAYNANAGLPFVPSYGLSADLPNAEALVPGNEVRISGVRVGQIQTIEPQADEETGETVARLNMKLDKDLEPLPDDSRLIVRARSALGLKYLEIVKGESDSGYEPGAVIPASEARPEPVEIDEVLNTFDAPTRSAIRRNLVEFGNALAGRGPNLNAALGRLPETLALLEPVMANLSSPRTALGRWVSGAAAAAAEVAPVAEQQAQTFVSLDITVGALARVARPYIQDTISETPPTFAVATETLPTIRPFLANSADLLGDLRPGINELAGAAPTIASALEVGVPALRESPRLNRQLAPTAEALLRFNDDQGVRDGIDRLDQTVSILKPAAGFIAPAQSVCNYATLAFRNLASANSIGGQGARMGRITVFATTATAPNSQGSPAAAPASGGEPDDFRENFLHFNPYPNTASPGQSPVECEAGNESYEVGRTVIGNDPGDSGLITEDQLRSQIRRGERLR